MFLETVCYNKIVDLEGIADQWNALAGSALEQNINYESTPLLSLLKNIHYPDWCVVTVWSGELLVGFFPLQQTKTYKVPIKQYTTLFENHFMSCTPLVHVDYASEAVRSFVNWLNADTAKLFHINEIFEGSAYGDLMHKALHEAGLVVSLLECRDRAAITDTAQSYTDYYSSNFSKKTRNTLERKRKKLSGYGTYKVKTCTDQPSSVETLLDNLIDVEAKSWKNLKGTAIALHPKLRAFMLETALHAAKENRLVLAVSYLNEDPLAAQYYLVNDKRLLCYKLGYDEAFGKYSPGQLLMLDVVEHCLDSNSVSIIDSCADEGSAMFNRSLRQRVHLNKYRIASSHFSSSLFLRSVMVVKKWVQCLKHSGRQETPGQIKSRSGLNRTQRVT